MKCIVIDTSAWYEFFKGNEKIQEIIKNADKRKTPASVLAELTRTLLHNGINEDEVKNNIKKIQNNSIILNLDANNAFNAGKIGVRQNLAYADGIHYSFVDKDEEFLTLDSDFKDKPNVTYIPKTNH